MPDTNNSINSINNDDFIYFCILAMILVIIIIYVSYLIYVSNLENKECSFMNTLYPGINNKLKEIFNGTDYRFCSHNDIGINRVVGWHKDKLNNKYASFETINIWSTYNNQKHEIVKVLIYLQKVNGIKLVPKSHNTSVINGNNSIEIKHNIGDVIIFDQRITHRGMEKQCSQQRILISFGFGKNNIFTDNFEKGTKERK